MLQLIKIPDYVPEGFRFEADEERFVIYFRRPYIPFLFGAIVLAIVVVSQLIQIPTALRRLWASTSDISWSWSYPENLIWLGPLGFTLFLIALAFTAYALLAQAINQQVLTLTSTELVSFEQPFALNKKQTVKWSAIQSISAQKNYSGAGYATSTMFHVVLTLKDDQTIVLQNFHRQAEADCVAEILNHYFWQRSFSVALEEA